MRTFRSSVAPATICAAFFLVGVSTLGCGGSSTDSSTSANTGGGGAPKNGQTTEDPAKMATHAAHRRCGWMGGDTWDAGKASFLAQPDYFDAIHPKWFTLNPDGNARSLAHTDDHDVVAAARAHGVHIIPLIDADDVSYLRGILSSPGNVQAHAQMLAALVAQHGYDGIELDYEHLWSAGDRPAFTALVVATGQLLHAQGKVLTLALPAQDSDDGNSAYDYASLAGPADILHLMGYDYHYLGGDHIGPLAPVGWLDSVGARVQQLGIADHVVIGVANYALGAGWYSTINEAVSRCGGQYDDVTDHMQHCSYGVHAAGRAPHCNTPAGVAWFEDAASITEKASAVRARGVRGIGYWTLGNEPNGFLDAIRQQFPQQ